MGQEHFRPSMSKKLFGFSRQVKGQVGNRPVLPVAPFGEAQSVLRPVFRDIALEGGRGFILTALGFHGDDFGAILQYKVISLFLSEK